MFVAILIFQIYAIFSEMLYIRAVYDCIVAYGFDVGKY